MLFFSIEAMFLLELISFRTGIKMVKQLMKINLFSDMDLSHFILVD